MSTLEDELWTTGHRHHDSLLKVLVELEAAQKAHPDDLYPLEATRLQAAIWEFLKSRGRRDYRGVVDEDIALPPVPWVPSAAQLAAHAAGLPVPPDEEDQADHG